MRRIFVSAALAFVSLGSAPVSGQDAGSPRDALVEQALQGSAEERRSAVASLRQMGPDVTELLASWIGAAVSPEEEEAAHELLDEVCAQRHCAASRLFWFTSFEAALEEAERTGRPILSLRLLGRLDEDLSCANSRFFRTVLYPDEEVGRLLREDFVLHWRSVREVPKVVVDYGGGRKLEGTLTGNSIHYVLDSRGRLVDALPGLYDPATFGQELEAAGAAAREAAALSNRKLRGWAASYHTQRLANLDRSLEEVTATVGWEGRAGLLGVELNHMARALSQGEGYASAAQAARMAMSKMVVEKPLLTRIGAFEELVEPLPGEDVWRRYAARKGPAGRLGAGSRALLMKVHGLTEGEEGEAVIERVESFLALDTVRNEQMLRRTLHHWLQGEPAPVDLEAFNENVYGRLFRTPLKDPWLGLAPQEIYAGLTLEATPGGEPAEARRAAKASQAELLEELARLEGAGSSAALNQ